MPRAGTSNPTPPSVKPRRKQPDITREALLDAADAGFGTHGYAATGIGGLVGDAGLTKGALFHHFPDKRGLALAWIDQRLGPSLATHWIEPLDEVASLADLKAFFRARLSNLKPSDPAGVLTAMTAETSSTDPALGEALARWFSRWRDALRDCLEQGKAAGWIHRSIVPETEAAFLNSAVAGITVMSRCRQDDAFRLTQAAAIEAYLDTLRPA